MSDDAKATREHCIFTVLVGYTGQTLTPDVVDKLRDEIVNEMESGPMSWAFQASGE